MNRSLRREFFTFVFLNILGQMAYSCYTMADTFFVAAKLGTDGLTALNLAFPVFCLMNGLGLLVGMGGGTRYAICRSRELPEQGNRAFSCAAILAAAFSCIFLLTGIFFSQELVRFLGADGHMFAMTHSYLQVMLLFAPAFFASNLPQCFIRNDGNPSLATAAMITGCACNILLDYVFVFPLDMGIFGAILATGLSPVISLLVMSPYLLHRKNRFHFVKPCQLTQNVQTILSGGFPSFLSEATSGVVMFLFNALILPLAGNVGVAAFGVVSCISLVVIAVYTGLSQGIQPLLSRYHGAKEPENVKSVFRYAVFTAGALSLLMYGVICFGAHGITALFDREGDPILAELAVRGLRLYFLACPFVGFHLMLATRLAATEHPVPARWLSLMRGCLVLIPVAMIMACQWKMTGVWLAYPVTECIVFLLVTFFRKHMLALE